MTKTGAISGRTDWQLAGLSSCESRRSPRLAVARQARKQKSANGARR